MNKVKYEYGVEYETNGEPPMLDEDVLIEAFFDGEWQGEVKFSELDWSFGKRFCSEVTKFRIVDERYKPKPEEPNWHERGENPPAGTECEVSNCGQDYAWCKIKYMGSSLCVVDHKSHSEQHYHLSSVKFRPIQSSRDKLIDKCTAILAKGVGDCEPDKYLAEQIVNAGWRPVKQQTEDEFVEEITHWNIDYDEAKNLYRSGCRFMEVGDE